MTEENPPVEAVLNQVGAAVRETAGLPLGDGAVEHILERLEPPFVERLKSRGVWARDGENVLRAARQLGIIATAIARLRQNNQITQDVIDVSTTIVQDQCKVGFSEGRWCT